jgi:hypothetical protein
MRNLIIILLLTFVSETAKSQSYLNSDVIQKAESCLKTAVGEDLFIYFKLDPNSYYEYKTKSGKTKWGKINKGKRTKGIFISGKNIRYILDHPEFPYLYVDKRMTVPLASELKLESKINLDKIPDFLLKGEKSDWLNDNQLDLLISQQGLKASSEKLIRRLEYDTKSKEYFWIVFNTLYKEKCFSEEEILYINPKSGKILKHYEDRQYVMHCY